jgi:hypothetical protein
VGDAALLTEDEQWFVNLSKSDGQGLLLSTRFWDFDFYVSFYINELAQRYPSLWGRLTKQLGPVPGFVPSDSIVTKSNWWWFVGQVTTPGVTLEGRAAHSDNLGATGTYHLQVAGMKRWTLKPSDACGSVCGNHSQSVVLEPGQFISLNTDLWTHSTELIESSTELHLSAAADYFHVDQERYELFRDGFVAQSSYTKEVPGSQKLYVEIDGAEQRISGQGVKVGEPAATDSISAVEIVNVLKGLNTAIEQAEREWIVIKGMQSESKRLKWGDCLSWIAWAKCMWTTTRSATQRGLPTP